VEIELDVQNRFLTKDLDAYNTFGDIRGAERPGEYVVIGAHLDSWHAGTGATDNAGGVAVVIEAMRILRALDLHPRRTIRVALWSGEEQRERGSTEWLKSNPALKSQISAYLNVDYETGRIRSIDIGDYRQAAGISNRYFGPSGTWA
jgi:acetylornithine deacetylase/succinyl-diaminopimelate desuccinylase-like protein